MDWEERIHAGLPWDGRLQSEKKEANNGSDMSGMFGELSSIFQGS